MGFWVPERRDDPEIMDRPDNLESDLEPALRDIRHVNRLLGGAKTLLRLIDPYLKKPRERPLRILDVGTGGADLPIRVVQRARELGREVEIVGVDRDPITAGIARRWTADYPEIEIVEADAGELPFEAASFDLVTVSLFMHHFTLKEGADLLRSFRSLAREAVLVNDLRRDRLAWFLILAVGRLTVRAPMFRHDAPLSVLRAFTAAELQRMSESAGASRPRIRRCWPFRLGADLDAKGAS